MNQQAIAQAEPNKEELPTTSDHFLETALSIGRKLAREAIWYQDRCNWTGDSLEVVNGKHKVELRSFDAELYSGISGIALALSKLCLMGKDEQIEKTFEGAVNTVLWQMEQKNKPSGIGIYNGALGVGWALWQIGQDHQRKDLQTTALKWIKKQARQPIGDHEIDIINGASGAILFLLKIWRSNQDSDLLAIAKKCGKHLLKRANRQENYWSWPSGFTQFDLTGFSHGAGGCALALLELYYATNNEEFLEGAQKGFAYERHWFSKEQGNWPDLREYNGEGAPTGYGMAWCHGAPGVVLSRLRAYELTADKTYWEEAQVAMTSTYNSLDYTLKNAQNSNPNFSICHGAAGNADILLEAGIKCNFPPYFEIAKQLGARGIEWYDKNDLDWPSGVNDPTGATMGQGETPGLMLGLAGTAYFYLRLAFPNLLPSVLY